MSKTHNWAPSRALSLGLFGLLLIGTSWLAYRQAGSYRPGTPVKSKQARVDLDKAVLREKIPSSFAADEAEMPVLKPAIADYKYIIGEEVPDYDLRFTPENWELANSTVAKMIKQKTQLEEDKVWAACTFVAGGREYEAKARIRGILPNHWTHESYKSWRIRFPKNALFQGKRTINLIIIPDRAYYMEALGNHLMRNKGLIAFRDGFARVHLNGGEDWHLYYMVETPTAELLEVNHRPVTAVFRQNDIGWETLHLKKSYLHGTGHYSEELFDNYIKNNEHEPQYRAALGKLLGFSGPEELSRLMDVEKYAILHGLTVVAGIHHALNANNLYYYFDNTRGVFEPIMWDVHAQPLKEEITRGIDMGPQQHIPLMFKSMLKDPHYRYLRDKAIWSWVADDGKQLLEILDYMDSKIRPLIAEWPKPAWVPADHYRKIDEIRGFIENNCKVLKRELSFTRAFTRVYMGDHSSSATVNMIYLKNGSFAPIDLERVQLDGAYAQGSEPARVFWDKDHNKVWDDHDPEIGTFVTNAGMGRLVFEPKQAFVAYSELQKDFAMVAGHERLYFTGATYAAPIQKAHIQLRNKVTQILLDRIDSVTSLGSLEQMPEVVTRSYSRSEFLRRNRNFRAIGENQVTPTKTVVEVQQDLVIPKGVTLVLGPGTQFRLAAARSLICYGSVQAEGTADKPILFEPLVAGKPFGVIALVGSGQDESNFRHVRFSGYSEASYANTFFSGGLSLYGAPANLEYCSFIDGRGEDALNYKNSSGFIRNCLFQRNPSDAIDLDWSNVSISGCRFEDNGGDGIDLSGSLITITDNIILRSHDKGISLGEDSEATIKNNYIAGCKVGIAAKDLSEGKVWATTLIDNQVALTAYQKKAIFGGGRLELALCVLQGNKLQASQDLHSRMIFHQNRLQKIPPGQSDNTTSKPHWLDQSDGTRTLDRKNNGALILDAQAKQSLTDLTGVAIEAGTLFGFQSFVSQEGGR